MRQSGQQLSRLPTAVGFHHTDHDVTPGLVFALRRAEHGVGLAYPRAGAEIDAQLAAPRTRLPIPDLVEQLVRVGSGRVSKLLPMRK